MLICTFALGGALNPFVPWACGHAVVAVHQESHTSSQSFTQACVQLWELPGPPHCSCFMLESPHWEMTQLRGQAKCSCAIGFGAGSSKNSKTYSSCTSRVTHCPMCPQLAVSENHLGNICFLWNIDRAKAVPALLAAPLAAEQTCSGCCLFPRACQGSTPAPGWGIYCTGTSLFINWACITTLAPHSEHKRLKNNFLPLPRKKQHAVFHLSCPGQMHVTNNCKQWTININKAFNWNPVEKHFLQHSWQEPPWTNAAFLPSTTQVVTTSQQRLRTYVNIMAEAWAFQSMCFIDWSNLGILPKFSSSGLVIFEKMVVIS